MAKVGFTVKLSDKQIGLMMQLEKVGLYGDTRAEIASNLIVEQLKRLVDQGEITPSPNTQN